MDTLAEDLQDIFDEILDWLSCVISQLLYVPFIVVLVGSLLIKEGCIRPRLEQYLKRTYPERLKVKKRRYRDMLSDPVLVIHIEEKILRRPDIQGDREKMLTALQELREQAEDKGIGDKNGLDSQATKGQEKKEAAELILRVLMFLSILGFFLLNTMGDSNVSGSQSELIPVMNLFNTAQAMPNMSNQLHPVTVTARAMSQMTNELHPQSLTRTQTYYPPKIQNDRGVQTGSDEYYDYCGMFGSVVSYALFFLVHLIHSYNMLKKTTGNRKRSFIAVPKSEDNAKADLERPLPDSTTEQL